MEVDDTSAAPEASANPFATVVVATHKEPAAPPLKRKSEVVEPDAGKPPKRVDTGKAAPQVAVMPKAEPAGEKDESGDESDSEGSVQIDMTLDDDEEEEDEEDDE